MTDKLKNIEDDNFRKMGMTSPAMSDSERGMGSPRMLPQAQDTYHQGSPNLRHRMDPGYIIEPENPVPVKKVR